MTRIHKLKIDVEYFDSVECGDKPFEIRYNDRGYQKGDVVELHTHHGIYRDTSRPILCAEISYVTAFQQKDGWVVLGLKNVEACK